MKHYLENDVKQLKYYFVSKDMMAPTALMKCGLPTNAINILGGFSKHISLAEFVIMSRELEFDDKSVITFLKVSFNLEEDILNEIDRTRDRCFAMFCDISDDYHIFIEEKSEIEVQSAKRFFSLMNALFYESSELKKAIEKYDENLNAIKIRHPHTNCVNTLNPFSPLSAASEDYDEQYFKPNNLFRDKGCFTFGYIGRPKHCTDFLRINRAIFNMGVVTRFIACHPNLQTSFGAAAELDMGFSLYDFDDWARKFKPVNKVMNYWSLGIPCLMSPFTSYKELAEENDIDFSYYEIPDRNIHAEDWMTDHHISLASSDALTEKIMSVFNDPEFHQRREHTWHVSRKYNPINISFLYDEMFQLIREKLG